MVRLEVTVVAATNLLQKNKLKKNNSFARIHLGNQKRKTKIIQQSNDPEWKEIFLFDHFNRKDILYVTVYTEDKIIGIIHIKLLDLFKKKRIDQWYHIPAKIGLACYGQIHLILKYKRDEE